jgi:oligopeptide/dipeptide ABC transporter ATP-binding protein
LQISNEGQKMLLNVEHLRIAFKFGDTVSVPVRDVSFTVAPRQRTALVGESGCGKSLTSLAVGGLVERAEISGKIEFAGNASGNNGISYIFQNPMQSLNPVMLISKQIREAAHGSESVESLLEAVGLPCETARKYPCQLSGGQQQRVMIAMALAAHPSLLIADEPTTALDVTTQKEVLDLIARLSSERGMAVLLITHNLGLVARYSDFVNVMYAGQIVEKGNVADILSNPRHPYTKGLIAAVPRLDAPKDAPIVGIGGVVPPPWKWPDGCAFHPRCPYADEKCKDAANFSVCRFMC